MRNFRFFSITLLIILLYLPLYAPLYAKSSKADVDNLEYEEKDLTLREIRSLIRKTNYDEALKLLTI